MPHWLPADEEMADEEEDMLAGDDAEANLVLAASLLGMPEEELYVRVHMDIPDYLAPLGPLGREYPNEPGAITDAALLDLVRDPCWMLVDDNNAGGDGANHHMGWPPDHIYFDSEANNRDCQPPLGMANLDAFTDHLPDAPDPIIMPGPSRRAAAVNAYLPSPWTFEPLPHAATAVELNKSAALQLHTPLAHSLVPGVGVAATDMPNHASALALPTPGDQPPHSPDGYRIASAATDWASSGSSMALCTPSTGSSPALSAGPPFSNPGLQGFGTPWGAGGLYSQMATQNGSDSMEWTAKTKRGAPSPKTDGKRPREGQADEDNNMSSRPRKRGKFRKQHRRSKTALAPKKKCCSRCRMLEDKCQLDSKDPQAVVCTRCKTLELLDSPVLSRMPCLRYLITDSTLYREQDMPYQGFSRRWRSMDLVDIDTWASPKIRTIKASQVSPHAPYEIQVREFVPAEGDTMEEVWTTRRSVLKRHRIPPFAICDLKKTAAVLEAYIDRHICTYVNGVVYDLDTLLWTTYRFAFGHMGRAKTQKERDLVRNCFRLWVGCLKNTHPEHIFGDDDLGADKIDDGESLFDRKVPMPVVMMAQLELIMHTRVLRPMTRAVLRSLEDLVVENKPQHWLTIYLTMFILLHCCSILTRREWELAMQCGFMDEFAHHESVMKHHTSMRVMLAHWHHLTKGIRPFGHTFDAKGKEQLARLADLSELEVDFVTHTNALMQETYRRLATMHLLNHQDLVHDLFWVSQLYVERWTPELNA